MDFRDETLELASGQRIAARTWGRGECRVLALHGWIDNVASFSTLAPLLEHTTFVAIDLPGHGQSDWRSGTAEYHYVDWVPVVWDVLEALEWDRVCLVGHSMGAGIAALFAGVFRERVERLVLLEGLGPYTTPAAGMLDNMRRAIEARAVHLGREPRPMVDLDAAVARKLAALPYLGEAAARPLVERGTRMVEDGVVFSHDPRLTGRSLLRYTEEQVLTHLRAITASTLVIWADDGLQYPEGAADPTARVEALHNAEVVRVPGHHHVHLTHPERVVGYIEAFLDGG